jgi:Mg/Co/Ni transporter MgtE
MEALMYVAIGLASINSAILAGLVFLYAKISIRSHASYSIGLAFFAGMLLLQNLLTAFAYGTMSPLFGSEALPYLSTIGGAELVGLLMLLRITF